jgi:GntR family transcriptional regulator
MPARGPLHRRIADELRRQILEKQLVPGHRLPSEHELARRYVASRGTIRHALSTLRAEGAIVAGRGSRWVVLGEPLVQSFSELVSFSAWARAEGHVPGGSIVELARRPATKADVSRLAVLEGEPVFHLVRIRLLSGVPVMIERTSFVEAVGSLLVDLDLEHDSIYEQLGDRGIVFARARHTIDAVAASADDARLLDVPRRTPLLRERRSTTSPAGQPLEWSDDRYRGDTIAFVVDNTAMSGNLERLLAEGEAAAHGGASGVG